MKAFLLWSQKCCRILFLHEGKVVWEGTTAEFETSTNPIVRQVIHSMPFEDQLAK
jgi:ABC-type transporter Mla maintaining outer membrane lipid asymmetry ATPase subunit MlaF